MLTLWINKLFLSLPEYLLIFEILLSFMQFEDGPWSRPWLISFMKFLCNMAISCRNASPVSSGRDLISNRGSYRHEEWNADLLGCCSEPYLCMSAFTICSFILLSNAWFAYYVFLITSFLENFPVNYLWGDVHLSYLVQFMSLCCYEVQVTWH